jgi:hypothetical protein
MYGRKLPVGTRVYWSTCNRNSAVQCWLVASNVFIPSLLISCSCTVWATASCVLFYTVVESSCETLLFISGNTDLLLVWRCPSCESTVLCDISQSSPPLPPTLCALWHSVLQGKSGEQNIFCIITNMNYFGVIRGVWKISKSDCWIRHVCPSVRVEHLGSH